jgi:acetylornithine deacetylase/succinyl-diaminopimelate desuccinylase-like protein
MDHHLAAVTELARDLVAIDSRSAVSNLGVAERLQRALTEFDVEPLDYTDAAGVPKRAIVARRGRGGLALSGHMDTVPETGWTEDPWSARIDGDVLHGLGSTDMKGPVAAIVTAARALPAAIPITLLLTTDEETTKAGARHIVVGSALLRAAAPRAILVAEPTGMVPVRGHRAHIAFTATATGVQAHSSTGRGRNANWDLLPFLSEMRELHRRLRDDTALHDPAYDPPFSDFNLVIDNHGAAVNVTVPVATARIKFRYSAALDPMPVRHAVRDAAARAGVALTEAEEGAPPDLPADHWLIAACRDATGRPAVTAPYGTDASVLQEIAPCVVLGPGDIAVAHTPRESVSLAALAAAVPLFMRLAEQVAAT